MLLRENYLRKSCWWASSSLRHFYALNALRTGVGMLEVALNMGMPVQMTREGGYSAARQDIRLGGIVVF
jgi:hypothetical protein